MKFKQMPGSQDFLRAKNAWVPMPPNQAAIAYLKGKQLKPSFNYRDVWHKKNARPQPGFNPICEYILYGSKGKWQHECYLQGHFTEMPSAPIKRQHMTEKPLGVLSHCLQCLPEPGVVFDPFMGSGSTGEAALKLGHSFIGFEKSAHYFNVAQARLNRPDLLSKLNQSEAINE